MHKKTRCSYTQHYTHTHAHPHTLTHRILLAEMNICTLQYIQLFLLCSTPWQLYLHFYLIPSFSFLSVISFFLRFFFFLFSGFDQSECLLSLCSRSCLHSALNDDLVATFALKLIEARRKKTFQPWIFFSSLLHFVPLFPHFFPLSVKFKELPCGHDSCVFECVCATSFCLHCVVLSVIPPPSFYALLSVFPPP